jgi:hypothetical protein
MNKIYVVDTFSQFEDDPTMPVAKNRRCVGWFPTFGMAEAAVLKNLGDIYEMGSYPYAQIEEVQSGMYGSNPCARWWYEWDNGQYRLQRYPEQLKHLDICGIG